MFGNVNSSDALPSVDFNPSSSWNLDPSDNFKFDTREAFKNDAHVSFDVDFKFNLSDTAPSFFGASLKSTTDSGSGTGQVSSPSLPFGQIQSGHGLLQQQDCEYVEGKWGDTPLSPSPHPSSPGSDSSHETLVLTGGTVRNPNDVNNGVNNGAPSQSAKSNEQEGTRSAGERNVATPRSVKAAANRPPQVKPEPTLSEVKVGRYANPRIQVPPTPEQLIAAAQPLNDLFEETVPEMEVDKLSGEWRPKFGWVAMNPAYLKTDAGVEFLSDYEEFLSTHGRKTEAYAIQLLAKQGDPYLKGKE